MASRVSFTQLRLEVELERCRAECQWDKVPAIIEQMRAARFHEDDDYGNLLMAETFLEECVQENMDLLRSATPLMDKTQPGLCRAKSHLNTILSRGRLTPRYLNEALLLMAKVHYVQGRYRDAQGMCARVGLEELTQDDQPTYHLRLLAEAFVIKGLSLDHQMVSAVSRVRLSEREEESLSCYLRACDAALSYLQELDKTVTTPHTKTAKGSLLPPPVDMDLGYFLQAALQSAYICLLQRGCFCPQDVVEEAVLLLLITESMASGEAVISRLPDQAEARQASLQDATSVYDLLTIGMARRGQAHSLDPLDAQVAMYLALQLALVRQVSAAMEPLQAALSLRRDDLHSLHLLILLLSAQKHHRHALDALGLALSQHPDNFK
ncbi:hypothetical protein F2P81_019909 [Scophthalmus maximus]|uniref:Tetratricopeptide repeat protein 7 N-terminal domain-containing protein n=1 Tax=Scophthalmus maximus TaxID=52904 RepID=A0A6A4S4Q8_SCOMX|nr:hypothetical protein F2P81_019909 [Scophthalmus maximus]